MFTHLPGTYITCAKSLGGAALVILCTGHLGKSVTSHVRAHVWEGLPASKELGNAQI